MKLLSTRISHPLPQLQADLFPGSDHVQSISLDCASDHEVWDDALENRFALVTKDADYNHLSVLRGGPPNVFWLQLGNCMTEQVAAGFRDRFSDIEDFEQNDSVHTLVLS